MAEAALYKQLTKYNEKIQNDYKDNWGSVLTFLGGQDIDALIQKSDEARQMQTAAGKEARSLLKANNKVGQESGRALGKNVPGSVTSIGSKMLKGQESLAARSKDRKKDTVITRHAVSSETHSRNVCAKLHPNARVNPLLLALDRVQGQIQIQQSNEDRGGAQPGGQGPFASSNMATNLAAKGFFTTRQGVDNLNANAEDQLDQILNTQRQGQNCFYSATTSKDATVRQDSLAHLNHQLEPLSLGLLDQQQFQNEGLGTLGKPSLDTADPERTKASRTLINQQADKGASNYQSQHSGATQWQMDRKLSGLQPNRYETKQTAMDTNTNSMTKRGYATSTSAGQSSSLKGATGANFISQTALQQRRALKNQHHLRQQPLVHDLICKKHLQSSQEVRAELMFQYHKHQLDQDPQHALRKSSQIEDGRQAQGLLFAPGGKQRPNFVTHAVLNNPSLEAVKEVLTPDIVSPDIGPGAGSYDVGERGPPQPNVEMLMNEKAVQGLSFSLGKSIESESEDDVAMAQSQSELQRRQMITAHNANLAGGSGRLGQQPTMPLRMSSDRRTRPLQLETEPFAMQTTTAFFKKPSSPMFVHEQSKKDSLILERQLGLADQSRGTRHLLSPQAIKNLHFASQAAMDFRKMAGKSQRTFQQYKPGMLFQDESRKYYQTGGNYKYEVLEEASTYFNARMDIVQAVQDAGRSANKPPVKLPPSARRRAQVVQAKSLTDFKQVWKPALGDGTLTQKSLAISKGQLSFNLEQHVHDQQQEELRRGFTTTKAEMIQLHKGGAAAREFKKSLAHVSPRVQDRQDPERTTAFGFPTIHGQNPKQKRRLRIQAGVPHENLTSVTGEILKHTRQIENETLVTKNNHLQYCIKLYDYEEKKSEQIANGGRNKRAADDDDDGKGRPRAHLGSLQQDFLDFQPYDIEKLSATLQDMQATSNENGPRAVPMRPEEKIIFQTKKRLLNETHGQKKEAILAQEQRTDYAIGSRKKFGDDFAKAGPNRYLGNLRQEKWLEKRAPLTVDQVQQKRKKAHLKKSDKLDGAANNNVSNEPDAPQHSEKALQKKQLQVAQELFLIWDGDGEGSLSADELMKAFIQIGLSQDPQFAKKIMQNIRPQKKSSGADGSDGEEQDIELKDFIKIFKKDEVSENLIKVINQEVILRRKLAIRKAVAANQRKRQMLQWQAAEPEMYHIGEVGESEEQDVGDTVETTKKAPRGDLDTLSRSSARSSSLGKALNQQPHGEGRPRAPAQFRSHKKSTNEAAKRQMSQTQRSPNLSDLPPNRAADEAHQAGSILSGPSYKLETGSNGMNLFSNKFGEHAEGRDKSDFPKQNRAQRGTKQVNITVNHVAREDKQEEVRGKNDRKKVARAAAGQASKRAASNPKGPGFASGKLAPIFAPIGRNGHDDAALDEPKCHGVKQHDAAASREGVAVAARKSWKMLGLEAQLLASSDLGKTPTLGEQNDVIKDWWTQIVASFVRDANLEQPKQPRAAGQSPGPAAQAPHHQRVTEVPLSKVYDLLMKKRLVADHQGAISLIQQQIGMAHLQTQDMMSRDEFSKLYSKGQFKTTLINTISKLQEQKPIGNAQSKKQMEAAASKNLPAQAQQSQHPAKNAETQKQRDSLLSGKKSGPGRSARASTEKSVDPLKSEEERQKVERDRLLATMASKLQERIDFRMYIDQDAKQNHAKEMPLSLRIEKFQRQKLLQGLKPERDQEQREQLKYLQSLKFIQKFEPDDIDPVTKLLRERSYEEFLKDPLGANQRDSRDDLRQQAIADQFNKRIDFVRLEREVKNGFKAWQDYYEMEQNQDRQYEVDRENRLADEESAAQEEAAAASLAS